MRDHQALLEEAKEMSQWAIIPAYVLRSKLTKDEKLTSIALMALMDKAGWWEYDLEFLAFATAMPKSEVTDAIEGLKNRGLAKFNGSKITVSWAFRAPNGWGK